MSLYNSFDRNQHLGELATPLDTQQGVLTPAQRRAATINNLYGSVAYDATVLLSPNLLSGSVSDKFTSVPNTASGGVLAPHVTQVMSHSIRIKSADGTLYYVMATNLATNRTGGA